ncbi:MAG TPA: hypothetical protein VGM86_00815 [Thermoanaerobaculia bacterium]
MKRILRLTFLFLLVLCCGAMTAQAGDPDCESACSDQFLQCCTYGGCEQCSCQLALCRAGCGDPWYGC